MLTRSWREEGGGENCEDSNPSLGFDLNGLSDSMSMFVLMCGSLCGADLSIVLEFGEPPLPVPLGRMDLIILGPLPFCLSDEGDVVLIFSCGDKDSFKLHSSELYDWSSCCCWHVFCRLGSGVEGSISIGSSSKKLFF